MVAALAQFHHGVEQAWSRRLGRQKTEILLQNGSIVLFLDGGQFHLWGKQSLTSSIHAYGECHKQ